MKYKDTEQPRQLYSTEKQRNTILKSELLCLKYLGLNLLNF